MPAAFSHIEEERIRELLLAAGRKLFSQFGIRKTTLDALTAEAGIAKGSFYRFFPSKEELYMSIIEEEERRIHAELLGRSESCGTVDDLIDLAAALYRKAMESRVILKLITGDEYGYLVRKLPPERLELHQANDAEVETLFVGLIEKYGFSLNVRPEILSSMLRGLFLMTLHKQEVGAENFEEVLHSLIASVISYSVNDGRDSEGGAHDQG